MTSALLVASVLLLVGCAATRSLDDAPVAEGTNRAFAHTLETGAAPEAVWTLWTDVSTWPDWDAELDSVALDGPFVAGAEGRLVPTSGPAARFMVEAVEPGRSYTMATRLPMGSLRIRRSWAEAGAGRIAITHAVSFHGAGGRTLAGRLGPRFRRALPAVMARLVALAEAGR